jgi:hypothetical protein
MSLVASADCWYNCCSTGTMAVQTPHPSRTDHRATCGRPYSFWSFSYRAWRFS